MKRPMPWRRLALAGTGLAALGLTLSLPVLGQNQDAPESLLPPGFDDPPVATPTPTPAPAQPGPRPEPILPDGAEALPDLPLVAPLEVEPEDEEEEEKELTDAELLQQLANNDLPPGARRRLDLIGVITPVEGGFTESATAGTGGRYWRALLANIERPLVSRWGSILLRRALLSRTQTPQGINGADWVAERAALLLRMGEADAASLLIQEVDAGRYTPRLHSVAMNTYLATADPSGWCPLTAGVVSNEDPRWQLAKAICAGLSGEQSSAAAQIDRAKRGNIMPNVDLLLAEKAVGAGVNSQRSVRVEWASASTLNEWRFGLALATGIEPPVELYADADRKYQGWRVRAPMLSLQSRINAADTAAAMGVLSGSAMVDLYSAAYDDADSPEALQTRTGLLRTAYAQASAAGRLAAMQQLWETPDNAMARYAALVLTSHAAARLPVSELDDATTGPLIASMLAGGFDRNALRWGRVVEIGSLGWALLAVAAPDRESAVTATAIDAFADSDASDESRKTRFLVAGLAGLGRVDSGTAAQFGGDLGFDLTRKTRWTQAIDTAANGNRAILVALLAGAGMQGDGWDKMTPLHLYHIVRALDRVGLNAEARMIAAEAVARG